MKPYWSNEQHGLTIYCGDCLDVLAGLPEGIAQCCVTSPPYWGLRDYGVEGQLGLERTPEEYTARMVEVFRGVRRVLRDDATCWLNLGDSYANAGGGRGGSTDDSSFRKQATNKGSLIAPSPIPIGLKPKDLVGIPWRVALALQADGWWLRSDIIWAKANPLPESVTDRPTKSYEHIFLLAAGQQYYYDQHAVRERAAQPDRIRKDVVGGASWDGRQQHSEGGTFTGAFGRNLRDVWQVNTQPFPDAHFATFPPKLIEPCIRAGSAARACSECGRAWERVVERTDAIDKSAKGSRFDTGKTSGRDGGDRTQLGERFTKQTIGFRFACGCDAEPVPSTVLDPFAGSGTTLLVAYQEGRRGIGIELNEQYAEMAAKRLEEAMQQGRLFEPGEVADKPVQTTLEVEP